MYYRKGMTGLAYEIVINSNPCLCYIMEENTMTMQTLVMAHAAFGHSHFFKNNQLFKAWTDADSILDYLDFAKRYVGECEERYGREAVEQVLDAAHALMNHGVHRYPRKTLNLKQEMERERERRRHEEQSFSDLWRTLPRRKPEDGDADPGLEARRRALGLPEENILYFVEKASPSLRPWQRELIRIVRNVSQYFYPQKQTKVMNEGCATFVHHYIMNELHRRGQISDGSILEFLHSHSSVVFQPEFDDRRYSGINPYALGFAMMEDIVRIVTDPTEEDREWFPAMAGHGDWRGELKNAWANYRDESFIQQYLSPKVIRDFRLFALGDDGKKPYYRVSAIHDEAGYRDTRDALATMYDLGMHEPNLQVTGADLEGDRTLKIRHTVYKDRVLDKKTKDAVLGHLRFLWGYDVELEQESAEG
jgi:stage V sporulation protein R